MTHKSDRTTIDKVAKSILLGEDDIDDQEFLEDAIAKVDPTFTLNTINNGNKVIQYLDSLSFDALPCLIILDYNMPELNGAEILEVLKNKERYTPIPKIIWSTSSTPEHKAICLELGARDYIVKPANISSLLEVTKQMLSYSISFRQIV